MSKENIIIIPIHHCQKARMKYEIFCFLSHILKLFACTFWQLASVVRSVLKPCHLHCLIKDKVFCVKVHVQLKLMHL